MRTFCAPRRGACVCGQHAQRGSSRGAPRRAERAALNRACGRDLARSGPSPLTQNHRRPLPATADKPGTAAASAERKGKGSQLPR